MSQTKVKAVILIGGPLKGTRFRPLSFDTPKPLFPLLNQPLIYHHIKACASKLKNLVEILLVGFFEETKFEKFIQDTTQEVDVKIRYLKEEAPLGTAGGLYKFRKEIQEGLDEDSTVFILHGDIICTFPLVELLEFHKGHGKTCTMLTKRIPSATSKFGRIVVDESTHEILHYVEKPKTFISDLVNCGVYLFKMELFDKIATIAAKQPVETDIYDIFNDPKDKKNSDVRIQLELDVFRHYAAKKALYAFETNGYWFQIKLPKDSLNGSQIMLTFENESDYVGKKIDSPVGSILVHPSATVHPTAKIGGNVTIGKNVKIGAGVRIKNSIILDDVEIKESAFITNSIIGWKSVISQWCRIEGTLKNSGAITIFGENVIAKPEVHISDSIVLPHKELVKNYADQILL